MNGYTPQDYLVGKCRLPPDVAALPQKSYVYSGDISIGSASSGRLDLALDADSHFLVEGIEMLSSLQTQTGDSVTVQITDTTYSQAWSNIAVPMRDIAGYGNQVHELPFPNMLAPTGTLSFNITNSGGNTQQIYVAVHGRKFYNVTDAQRAFLMQRMWYMYGMSVPTIAAQVTGTVVNLQLFNESDFLLYKLLSYQAWAYIVGAAQTGGVVSGEIKCNFRDTSADRNFFSGQTALRLVVGSYWNLNLTGGVYIPSSDSMFRFIKPMFIRRNGLIQGTFDNISNGSTGPFIVEFEGARVFSAS